MEMCYNEALVMPSNYVVMDNDEMAYVDGGFYVSNSTLQNVCRAVFLTACVNPVGATLAALGVAKVYGLLVAGQALLTAKLGALGGLLGFAVGLIGVGVITASGLDIANALIQGKGIDYSFKYIRGTDIPYGIGSTVQ